MAFTYEEIKATISTLLSKDQLGANPEDGLHELADSFVPVYYNEIIAEWQAMPSEFDNAWQELGASAKNTITQLMSIDLYMYYLSLCQRAFSEIVESEEFSYAN